MVWAVCLVKAQLPSPTEYEIRGNLLLPIIVSVVRHPSVCKATTHCDSPFMYIWASHLRCRQHVRICLVFPSCRPHLFSQHIPFDGLLESGRCVLYLSKLVKNLRQSLQHFHLTFSMATGFLCPVQPATPSSNLLHPRQSRGFHARATQHPHFVRTYTSPGYLLQHKMVRLLPGPPSRQRSPDQPHAQSRHPHVTRSVHIRSAPGPWTQAHRSYLPHDVSTSIMDVDRRWAVKASSVPTPTYPRNNQGNQGSHVPRLCHLKCKHLGTPNASKGSLNDLLHVASD